MNGKKSGDSVQKRIKERINSKIKEECDEIVAGEDDICGRNEIKETGIANKLKRLYKDNCEDDDNATGNSRRRLPECDGDEEVGDMIDYAAQVRYVIIKEARIDRA